MCLMNPKRYLFCTTFALVAFAFASVASATPAANSAVVGLRHFNDCPTSNISVVDADFASVIIDDAVLDCFGFANRHSWSFSEDNINPAVFQNNDGFSFCALVSASGSGDGEVGLRVSPWWSLDVDGTFMLNTRSGEIACFGGRLPFYSFTGANAQTYVKGTVVKLSIEYKPNGLSAVSPATIQYTLENGNGIFTSGPLAFDQGNPAEDPPHGQWGMLSPARVGGYVQCFLGQGDPVNFRGSWEQICYDAQPVPAEPATWGKIKADYR
jgi:hypothetical protein